MQAWRAYQLGEPRDVLRLEEVPKPVPSSEQVLVRVLGAPANFPDVLMCRGEYQVRPPLPFTPGMELCGEVIELGAEAEGFDVGDRVLGAASGSHGAFGEMALMDVSTTFPAPLALDDAEAAALYVGYQTAWFALHQRAALRAGETLLVHAAAGGVGSAAVQLGKAAGANVVAVVGSAEKVSTARELGAEVVVDRQHDDFVDIVKEMTGGQGADVVYDPVGGEAYQRSTKCIAFEGRIVVVGFAGGEIQEAALNHALIKNYSILGLHWGLYQKRAPALVEVCQKELTKLAESGVVKPLVGGTFDIFGVPDALACLGRGESVGRLVCGPFS